jgi:hypothetical protein
MCDAFGVSMMDNHLHLLLRLDQDVAKGWSDEEVVRRWGRLFPPRTSYCTEHAVSVLRFSSAQAIGAVRRSFLVELDASGLVLLGRAIETGWIRAGVDEPKFQCRSLSLP